MPISDIVFLEGNDAEEVACSEDPYSYGKWFHAKNIDMIPLSKLGELLSVSSYKELMSGFQPIHPPEGEAFILSFPEVLQDKIKSLNDQDIMAITERWAKIDEFHGASEPPLRQYLTGLRDFLNSNSGYANIFLSI